MNLGYYRPPRIRFTSKDKLMEFLDLVAAEHRQFFGVDFLRQPDSVVINFRPRSGMPAAIRKWLDDNGAIGQHHDHGQVFIVAACHRRAEQTLRLIAGELNRRLRSGQPVRGPVLDLLWEITGIDVPAGLVDARCVGV